MRSGGFLYINKKQSLKELAHKYSINPKKLLQSNHGHYPKVGSWYFVPTKRGFDPKGKILRKVAHKIGLRKTGVFDSENFIWPVPSSRKISSKFGKRWGRKHEGIDIPARRGASVVSTADGVVIYSGSKLSGYGNLIVISHRGDYFSVYAHSKKNFVQRGQRVFQGQVIAQVGSTGKSTGPHLHFEIRKNSRAFNPHQLVGQF